MKRDPAKGLELPSTDRMTDTHVGGGPGTEPLPRGIVVLKADKTPPTGKGQRVIRPAVVPRGKRLKQGQ